MDLVVPKPDQATLDQFAAQTARRHAATGKLIRQLADSHSRLLDPGASPQTFTCNGLLSIEYIVVYNHVMIENMEFSDGTVLGFDGSGWGIGVGGGIAWGAGSFFIPPAQLIGDVSYVVQGFGPGVSVTFFQSGNLVGSFTAGGIAVGAGTFSGTGTFTLVS